MKPVKSLPWALLAAAGFGVAGYLLLGIYSQPNATYQHMKPVQAFLRHALAGDSAALKGEAGDQPIQWVSTAIRLDSAAVREWAQSRPRVTTAQSHDTLWVTLRRPGSTEQCSPLHPLTAGFLEVRGEPRLIHLSSSCPTVSRALEPDPSSAGPD